VNNVPFLFDDSLLVFVLELSLLLVVGCKIFIKSVLLYIINDDNLGTVMGIYVMSVTWHVVGRSRVGVVHQHIIHVLVVSTNSVPQTELLYSLSVLQSTLYNTNHQINTNIINNI
jgi:hypothetical protein